MAASKPDAIAEKSTGRVMLGDDETLLVSGQFDYENVVEARVEGEKLIRTLSAEHCRIDLSGVEAGDSVFMALLLSWMRLCEGRNIALQLVAIPESLGAMARVSGLEPILPVAPTSA